MSDRNSDDSTQSPRVPEKPRIPEPPPFDPDPKLIGDMQRSERTQKKR
jgi:hypothetical protein